MLPDNVMAAGDHSIVSRYDRFDMAQRTVTEWTSGLLSQSQPICECKFYVDFSQVTRAVYGVTKNRESQTWILAGNERSVVTNAQSEAVSR